VFSDDLLSLPDEQFLARWDSISARRTAGVIYRNKCDTTIYKTTR